MEQRLGTEEEIENFSKKYIVYKGKLKKYIDHLAVLGVERKKRAEKRKIMIGKNCSTMVHFNIKT